MITLSNVFSFYCKECYMYCSRKRPRERLYNVIFYDLLKNLTWDLSAIAQQQTHGPVNGLVWSKYLLSYEVHIYYGVFSILYICAV